MIVASPKPITELKNLIARHGKVLFVGCGTCVTVCLAGGEREVGIASYAIRMARKIEGQPLELTQVAIERQCENEFIKDLAEPAAKADAIVSFGCGAGHRRAIPRQAGLPRAEHAVPGDSGGAGGLDREMPRLRRLHVGRVRRHLPGDAVRQADAERPLRRLDRNALRGGCRPALRLAAYLHAAQGHRPTRTPGRNRAAERLEHRLARRGAQDRAARAPGVEGGASMSPASG